MALPASPDLAAALDGVEGWLGLREAAALYAAAAAAGPSACAVEVGSYKGRSTIALALGVRDGPGGAVHAIDPHRPGVAQGLAKDEDSWDAFLANLERAGVRDSVKPLRTTSAAACDEFGAASVDVLFLDGSHDHEDVLHDITAWQPKLVPGARVAIHDAFGFPGVSRAVRERVLARGAPFRAPRVVEETLLVHYRPGAAWRGADTRRALAMRAWLDARRAARSATETALHAVGRAK